MSKQRWFIVIVSFAAMIGISIWITRSGIDPAAIKVKVPLWAHALAVLAVATEVLTRALKIGWSAQALRIPLPYGLSVRTCLGGDFGAAITPSRSGAEPARFLILAEGGLRPSDVLMILFMELFLEMLSLVVIAIGLALAFPNAGPVMGPIVTMIGGYAAVILGIGAFGAAVARRNAHGPPPRWARRIGLHPMRWRRIQLQLRQLRISIDYLKHARMGMMALSLAASIVHVLTRLALLPLIVYSLGATNADLSRLILWPLAFLYGGAVVPLPGGGGVIEVAFRQLFHKMMVPNVLSASLVWWRFYTLYLYILLGAIAAGATVMRALRRGAGERAPTIRHTQDLEAIT